LSSASIGASTGSTSASTGVDQRLDGVDQRFAGVYQRFDRLEHEMRTGFAEMRGKFDQAAAGQQQIVDLITGLIPGQSEE
jgi:hypothetical protein